MNKAAYIVLAVFCVGFLVCLVITIPLLFWALRLEDEENGIIPEIGRASCRERV